MEKWPEASWSRLKGVYSIPLPSDAEPRELSLAARPCLRSAPFRLSCSSGRSRFWSSATQRVAAPGRLRRKPKRTLRAKQWESRSCACRHRIETTANTNARISLCASNEGLYKRGGMSADIHRVEQSRTGASSVCDVATRRLRVCDSFSAA
jgi:hypothetical protein